MMALLSLSVSYAQNSGLKISYAPIGVTYDYIKPAAICPNQAGGVTVVYNYFDTAVGLKQAGIVEFDSDGNVLGGIAEVTLQNPANWNYEVTQIIPYSTDQYFLTGWVENAGQKDVFVTLIHDYTNLYSEIFYQEININSSNDDIPLDAAKIVGADQFVVVGSSGASNAIGFTLRLNATGVISIAGTTNRVHVHDLGSASQALSSVTALSNGDYVVLGYQKNGLPTDQSIAAKIKGADDSFLKGASFSASDSVIFDDLIVNKDGNFIAVGHTGNSVPPFFTGGSFILELDGNLNVLNSTIFSSSNHVKSIHPTQSGNFVTAWTESNQFDPSKQNDIKIALHDKHGKMIKAI